MINRNKLEHILEYAKQQRHIGQSCKVPPEDMVEIMERLLNAGNSQIIPDGYVMVPKEPTKEMIDAGWLHYMGTKNPSSKGTYKAMLAAAPQPQNAPQNIPEIIPGWIPVSEQKPDCWCLTCRPVVLNDMRFVVCPDCGNKRCPRANDHRNACTGSNELGQGGSAYPDTPREVKP